MQLSPAYEKAKAYLEFCLKLSSEVSSSSQPVTPHFSSKGKDKEKSLPSTDSPKERYTELLFDLLEEPSIQENLILKKILENQVEELMNHENEELTEKEKVSYKWTKKLLGENKKVRQFVIEKLKQIYQGSPSLPTVAPQNPISTSSLFSSTSQPATTDSSLFSTTKGIQPLSPPSTTPISMASLYKAILQVHFPNGNRDLIKQAGILDKIYKIKPDIPIEEKVPYIFQKLFTLAASLSHIEFEGNTKESKAITLFNYSSYLLNINRLLIWQKLPGGTKYLNQVHIKALPLKKKGELLTQWIEEHDKNITYLDLEALGLTFLPPEIAQLSHLQTLRLDYNQLTSIPAAIAQLSHLHTLRLDYNQLTAIPAEIRQLSQLQNLYLSNNQLSAIPAEIRQLPQLQYLLLNNNQLTALPAAIGQLSQLQYLDLSNNQLTALPVEIGQLANLQWLYLSNNKLTSLPPLSQLRTLEIDGNPL
ncbi:hypothetical protein DB41_GJ00040 [Neochlamydia sp. TUME1]|uniref:leucine-rich repeat domain-containing protein n=1 Tax=Neochlamydia sp. TUME1 TaxID=1478174 RepID=UPI000583782C|nr:leucine-rich repeat domain-containing protein [Neochlamydia sp. TUME1]KIC76325.1 hypothetical protein DB41_GJ00040 [Neochlamydia sp. TUME1]